ncbi:IS66 family insertion sequence element accessory protein TnpB [Planctomycetota bacterium]|nr:IS66 family insertion sequence element accessory protein TnpB [Planctomycetota bacterium]
MTLPVTPGLRVYVAPGVTDMRKSFNGLVAATRQVLGADPLSGALFGFCNRRRTLVKFLLWDGTGYWVFAKRLERGTFAWPKPGRDDEKVVLSGEELAALLGGFVLDLSTRRRWWGRDREPTSAVLPEGRVGSR